MNTPSTFDECFSIAAGPSRSGDSTVAPYPYQRQLAEDGLPELLEVPTGCGKTLAVIIAWLWRRRFHPDIEVRAATPRRLVYVLPQRVLVEQVFDVAQGVVDALGLNGEVECAVQMGGRGRRSDDWVNRSEGDAILVATQDMALSAMLNRRFGTSRWLWPIYFGLFNNDCQFVFDEIQLMGPGLPTSRQLEGLRRVLGTAVSCNSTWMSATVDEQAVATVDSPSIATRVTLGDTDRAGGLAQRLDASRELTRLDTAAKTYLKDVAASLVHEHRPGSRTIAVCNTVKRATDLYLAVRNAAPEGVSVVLVHSRFRPEDRSAHLAAALDDIEPKNGGTIVVTTQVLEAGVDVSCSTMFSEAAPFASVVQRAGRCNRYGEAHEARLLWAAPPSSAPYGDVEIERTVEVLRALDGQCLSTEELVGHAPEPVRPVHQVLRRRDLLELFDTLPDLSGSDIDISRFVRDADDRELGVAWVDFENGRPRDDQGLTLAEERCPVPIGDVKELADLVPWRYDHLAVGPDDSVGGWVRARRADLRPGTTVVVDASGGGYDPAIGWSPKHRGVVAPVGFANREPGDDAAAEDDAAVADDSLSLDRPGWLNLRAHLGDTQFEATALDAAIGAPGLSGDQRQAAIVAAKLHDLGKAHPVFQDTMRRSAAEGEPLGEGQNEGPPWAKSPGRQRHRRRYFRHELASALALLDDAGVVLDGVPEADLVVYLVAAHHGRVRLGFRSLPDESPAPPELASRTVALGIIDGEMLPEVEVPGATLPASRLDLSVMQLGRGVDGRPSWSERMLPLRDRADLGPFRLGYLEALVRLADWRASAVPGSSRKDDV